ncbi:MAG: TIGR03435 family protein [Bryobacteraceae bacterium]
MQLSPSCPPWHDLNRRPTVHRLAGQLVAATLAMVVPGVVGLANAQSARTNPRYTFDVASVKAAPERDYGTGARPTGMAPEIQGNPGRIDFSDVSLAGVICRAYGLRPADLKTPAWMQERRYDIHANVPAGAPKGHIPEMLENLLADRFQMKVHWETREEPGYVLTVARNGLKLKQSAPDTLRMASFRSDGHFALRRFTMTDLANSLRGNMGRPVVNTTGVAGEYDIVFDAAPDSMPGLPPGLLNSDANGQASEYPTITEALRRLGLVLTPGGKVPVKYLVVDSALKVPTGN